MNAICIRCGEQSLKVDADDFDTITCTNCEEEFTVADVEEAIGKLALLVRCCKAARAVIDAEPAAA